MTWLYILRKIPVTITVSTFVVFLMAFLLICSAMVMMAFGYRFCNVFKNEKGSVIKDKEEFTAFVMSLSYIITFIIFFCL